MQISPSWEIDANELTFTTKIGQGQSSKVYRGLFRGQEVALKVLRQLPEGKELEEFKEELNILRYSFPPSPSFFLSLFLFPCLHSPLLQFCSKSLHCLFLWHCSQPKNLLRIWVLPARKLVSKKDDLFLSSILIRFVSFCFVSHVSIASFLVYH